MKIITMITYIVNCIKIFLSRCLTIIVTPPKEGLAQYFIGVTIIEIIKKKLHQKKIKLPNSYGILHSIGVFVARHIFIENFLERFPNLTIDMFNNITITMYVSVVAGGRIMSYLQRDTGCSTDASLIETWRGGLSIFGDYIGGLWMSCLIAYYYQLDTVLFIESLILTSSFQTVFGRLGNLINRELVGRYSVWLKRNHPQQLYQLVMEGIVMSWILWSMIDRMGDGTIWLSMPCIYSVIRIGCESFKEEDSGMPDWYRRTLYRHLKWARFQSLCLPVIFWSTYWIVQIIK